jgi:hypothetical protein
MRLRAEATVQIVRTGNPSLSGRILMISYRSVVSGLNWLRNAKRSPHRLRSLERASTMRNTAITEALEGRVLMALAGSGYSANLSSNPTIRKQQLLCDPSEPIAGSTSVTYDPTLVHLTAIEPGPGYDNEAFQAFVEVEVEDGGPILTLAPGPESAPSEGPTTVLQPLNSFLDAPLGPETGFVQVKYQLDSEGGAGQLPFDEGFTPIGHVGPVGVDTHGITFELLPGVPLNANISYTVLAAHGGTHSGNDEDFLEDTSHNIYGPDQLTSATVSSNPPAHALLQPDPSQPSKNALFVFGTDDNDWLHFAKDKGGVQVFSGFQSLGTFKGFTRVIAYGKDGNDLIGPYDGDAAFFGGGGNDALLLGNASGIASGGAGMDLISGGNGQDLLMGGADSDLISGGNGEDILVAGRTSYDAGSNADIVALTNILKEWTNGGSYATRISHITGATPGGQNGSSFFTTSGPQQNVFDDGAVDLLLGGNGRDWLLLHNTGSTPLDLSDLAGNEVGTNI